jgi:hypothetical protein
MDDRKNIRQPSCFGDADVIRRERQRRSYQGSVLTAINVQWHD